MKVILKIGRVVALLALTASAAQATPILTVNNGTLLATDPTQNGRLFRDGVASDWSDPGLFPGTTAVGTNFLYTTFIVNVGITPFIQIIADDPGTFFFVSAYDTAYTPAVSFGTNWLGDDGSSGNPIPDSARYFQVVVPTNHDLVIVVNSVLPAPGGAGQLFSLLVEGFINTDFDDPPAVGDAVPEPATMLLGGTGFALMALRRRMQARKKAA